MPVRKQLLRSHLALAAFGASKEGGRTWVAGWLAGWLAVFGIEGCC